MIIGIVGKANSGKNTSADYIKSRLEEENAEVDVRAFAEPLKVFASEVFSFPDELLWGSSSERSKTHIVPWSTVKRNFREITPGWIGAVLPRRKIKHTLESIRSLSVWLKTTCNEHRQGEFVVITPRTVLQTLGTDWGRQEKESIWVDYLFRKAETDSNTIITDIRFQNELQAVLSKEDSYVFRLTRNEGRSDNHKSEKEQEVFTNLYEVDNKNVTLEDLYDLLDGFLRRNKIC